MKKNILTIIGFMLLSLIQAQTKPEILQDYHPTSDSDPRYVNTFMNTLIYNSKDASRGIELQVCDGTVSGTKFLAELSSGTGNTLVKSSVVFNNKLFFSAVLSSGSEEKLFVLSDLSTTPQIFTTKVLGASSFAVIGNKLYFSATTSSGTTGYEPWVTDGTDAGTIMLKDISSGAASSYPHSFTEINGKVVFSSAGQLYTTDGTSLNTVLLKTINATGSSNMGTLIKFNGKVFFTADDGINGSEIWETDGTSSGTSLFKNINPTSGSLPYNYFIYNNEMYFAANNGSNGTQLWKTDGSSSNTNLVKIINNSGSTLFSDFCIYNNKLYFFATDGSTGYELWSTDGTNVGTTMFYDLNPGANSSKSSSIRGQNLISYGGRLFFRATDGSNGDELFSTTGKFTDLKKHKPDVTTSTNPLKSFDHSFQIVNNTLVFQADYNSNNLELWSIKENNVSIYKPEISELIIYPNPANNNIIQIKMSHDDIFKLIDLTGKILLSGNLSYVDSKIDIESIQNGIYVLIIGKQSQKIIINK